MPVSHVSYVGIIVPHAIVFEFRKKLFGALLIQMLDTAPTIGGHNLELLGMNLKKPWHERASVAFKVPKHTDFVGKALVRLRSAEGFMDAAIIADAHLRPQRILDLVHREANMAHEENQASFEAAAVDSLSRSRKSCVAELPLSPGTGGIFD